MSPMGVRRGKAAFSSGCKPLSLVKTSSTNQHPILCVRVRQHHSTENPRIRAADEVLTRDTWNNQLRQAILLHTHNAVLARAPIEGFLHQKNNLDTLGSDESESGCRLE